MKPLQLNRRVLTWLCGVPANELDTKKEKVQYIAFTLIVIMINSIAVISGATFIYRHISLDFELTLYSLYHTIGHFQVLYQSIATVLLRHKLDAIIQSLSTIYEKSMKNIDRYVNQSNCSLQNKKCIINQMFQ